MGKPLRGTEKVLERTLLNSGPERRGLLPHKQWWALFFLAGKNWALGVQKDGGEAVLPLPVFHQLNYCRGLA